MCKKLERFCPAGTEIWLKMQKLARSRSSVKVTEISFKAAYTGLSMLKKFERDTIASFCDTVANSTVEDFNK